MVSRLSFGVKTLEGVGVIEGWGFVAGSIVGQVDFI